MKRLLRWWRGEGDLSPLPCPFCGTVKTVAFCLPKCQARHIWRHYARMAKLLFVNPKRWWWLVVR